MKQWIKDFIAKQDIVPDPVNDRPGVLHPPRADSRKFFYEKTKQAKQKAGKNEFLLDSKTSYAGLPLFISLDYQNQGKIGASAFGSYYESGDKKLFGQSLTVSHHLYQNRDNPRYKGLFEFAMQHEIGHLKFGHAQRRAAGIKDSYLFKEIQAESYAIKQGHAEISNLFRRITLKRQTEYIRKLEENINAGVPYSDKTLRKLEMMKRESIPTIKAQIKLSNRALIKEQEELQRRNKESYREIGKRKLIQRESSPRSFRDEKRRIKALNQEVSDFRSGLYSDNYIPEGYFTGELKPKKPVKPKKEQPKPRQTRKSKRAEKQPKKNKKTSQSTAPVLSPLPVQEEVAQAPPISVPPSEKVISRPTEPIKDPYALWPENVERPNPQTEALDRIRRAKEEGKTVNLFFDTETTGIDHRKNKIFELGISAEVDGRHIGDFQWTLDPEMKLSRETMMVTGKRDPFHNKGLPTFRDKLLEIEEVFRGSHVFAHNADFDFRFINKELEAAGSSNTLQSLASGMTDTLSLARVIDNRQGGATLDTVAERAIGVTKEMRGDHLAVVDASLLRQSYPDLLKRLRERGDLEEGLKRSSESVTRAIDEGIGPKMSPGGQNVSKGLPRGLFDGLQETWSKQSGPTKAGIIGGATLLAGGLLFSRNKKERPPEDLRQQIKEEGSTIQSISRHFPQTYHGSGFYAWENRRQSGQY